MAHLKFGAIAAAILCLSLMPSMALANSGTPLMWAGFLHLFFGNTLIGIGEGLLLARIFRIGKIKCVALLIVANYFSAWFGGCYWIGLQIVPRLPLDFYNAWRFHWLMVTVAYAMTVVFEFPFVCLAFWRKKGWLNKAARGSLIIQTASYVLLFGWYGLASGVSLYTATDVVQPSAIALPKEVTLYYISKDNGDVYKQSLGATARAKVCDMASFEPLDRLFLHPPEEGSTKWGLGAYRYGSWEEDTTQTIPERFPVDSVPAFRDMKGVQAQMQGYPGPAPKLGSAHTSPWEFHTGFWAVEGLQGENNKTGDKVGFSFETLLAMWGIRNATHLPGDKVLFQLGEDQICVFDVETKRVARIAEGWGPVAVLRTLGEQ